MSVAPRPKRRSKMLVKFGDVRNDLYYWLNQRSNPAVTQHLKAENRYASRILKPISGLQKIIRNEIYSRIKQEDQSLPARRGNYLYFRRYRKRKEYPIYCRKYKSTKATEEILLDVNSIARKQTYTSVDSVEVSPDDRFLAYAVDHTGGRTYQIVIKDLKSGRTLKWRVNNVAANVVWAADSRTLFFVELEKNTLRSFKVWRINLETGKRALVYHETDACFSVELIKSSNAEFIFISSSKIKCSEYRYFKASQPDSKPILFQRRQEGLEYQVFPVADKFYLLTNYKAQNYQIMSCPLTLTHKKYWKSVVRHRKNVAIEAMHVFNTHFIIQERSRGLSRFAIFEHQKSNASVINFPDDTYSIEFGENFEFDASTFRYYYESMRLPPSIFEYHFAKGRTQLLETRAIPNYQPQKYKTKRIYAVAKDGKRIPISILYKLGATKAALINGYGAYGVNNEASFDLARISLVDRGFVYAIAHVRGGSELGQEWYDSGRLLKKKNTFTDFIACSQALITGGYCRKDQLFAEGASAGGLLVGAVLNMSPGLFRAVVSEVPFVDCLTTMLDKSLPLTTGEFDEWGNPEKRRFYNYIKSYSPYDNVTKQNYPHILCTTGLNDACVQYWEPAKWIAKIRDNNQAQTSILFKTDFEAGHLGKSGRFDSIEETALKYAFLIWASSARQGFELVKTYG